MITLCMIIVKLVIPTTLDNCYESGDAKKKEEKTTKENKQEKQEQEQIYIYIYFF